KASHRSLSTAVRWWILAGQCIIWDSSTASHSPRAHGFFHLMGRLYEVWGEHEGMLWATVVALKRPQQLQLQGSMMMPEPTYGAIPFQLEAVGQGTVLRLTHQAFGNIGERQQRLYAAGWKDLLDIRLRAFVERGIRHGVDQGTSGWRSSGP